MIVIAISAAALYQTVLNIKISHTSGVTRPELALQNKDIDIIMNLITVQRSMMDEEEKNLHESERQIRLLSAQVSGQQSEIEGLKAAIKAKSQG
ncbi:MAG: hypothetical protein ACRES7_05605 [Gammaproteobacteria bacterium]